MKEEARGSSLINLFVEKKDRRGAIITASKKKMSTATEELNGPRQQRTTDNVQCLSALLPKEGNNDTPDFSIPATHCTFFASEHQVTPQRSGWRYGLGRTVSVYSTV